MDDHRSAPVAPLNAKSVLSVPSIVAGRFCPACRTRGQLPIVASLGSAPFVAQHVLAGILDANRQIAAVAWDPRIVAVGRQPTNAPGAVALGIRRSEERRV